MKGHLKTHIGFSALFSLLSLTAAAQYKAGIRVIARSYGDSVVVRWAPTAAWAWNSLNSAGYTVERIDISDPKKPVRQIITPAAVKPLTLEQFKQHFDRNNKYAAAAAQCLYGKNFSSNVRKGYAGIGDQSAVFTDRYAFAVMVADYDAGVAWAEGLRITDKTVRKNAVYVYKVYPAAPAHPGKVDTGGVLIRNEGRGGVTRPALASISGGDMTAEVHWFRHQKESYSGFVIERSEDGRHFTPLNKDPFFAGLPDSMMVKKDTSLRRLYGLLKEQQVYIDSLPRNYAAYSYRVRGIDAFAEWSDYSDTLSTSGRDLTPPVPPTMQKVQFAGGKRMKLQWKKKIKEPDLKGLMVSRAHNDVNGPYEIISGKLLDPSVDQFTDTSAFIHGQNFYLVIAVDTANNMGASAPAMGLVPDKTPPAAPAGLKGYIEKNGRVHLSWNRNGEEDMKGYKVYFANSPDHVFSQITLSPYADTAFVDSISLKNLTRNIWYKVAAVDESNNHSAFSEAVKLRKPDIIPPVPPLASKIFVDTGGVQIDWIRSASSDVVQYIVYRKEKDKDWEILRTLRQDTTQTTFHFTDTRVKPFVEYAYSAEAVDEDSLHSAKSTTVKAAVKTVPDQPPVKVFAASYNEKQNAVRLTWQFRDEGEYFFVLYKAAGNEPLRRFRSESATAGGYTDPVAGSQKGVVRYAIQVLFRDERGRTRMSEPVTVSIPDPK